MEFALGNKILGRVRRWQGASRGRSERVHKSQVGAMMDLHVGEDVYLYLLFFKIY